MFDYRLAAESARRLNDAAHVVSILPGRSILQKMGATGHFPA
jgi:hypothetical protein